VQPTTCRTVPVITCDGKGVVSYAGTELLAELADRIGLTAALAEATDGLRERAPVMIRVGCWSMWRSRSPTVRSRSATSRPWRIIRACMARRAALRRPRRSGGSWMPSPTRRGMMAAIRLARAQARDRAWLARGELTRAELPGSRAAGKTIRQVVIDLDATLVTAHSDKEGARGNFKGGFGYHQLMAPATPTP